ncbi:Subtilase family protein [Allokutzneria albata]|uniref:Subtilase family protein n=1 Tax=Allokutzneria albata TaxID=211114 RepID=A0A1H0C483_ALLAB|nr:Subtilase family protein [Allokutzneria albata]
MPLTGGNGARRAAVTSVLLVAGLLAAPGPAGAAPEQPCGIGKTLRYIVVFDQGTRAEEAQRRIDAACGETVTYYPQIGVAVAGSRDRSFTDRLTEGRAFSTQQELGGQGSASRKKNRTRLTAAIKASPSVATTDRSGEQWDMAMIKADEAHRYSVGSRSVVVGVLDSGIDAGHPDLAAAVDPSVSAGCVTGAPDTRREAWQPSAFEHGTHVAGTIAAANDGKGTTGVAPGVRLASVKVVDDDGYVSPESAVCGFMWAATKGMRLVNSSFTTGPWTLTCKDRASDQWVVHEAMRRAVTYATNRGVLTVAAIGNEGTNLASTRCDALPGELRGVIGVSSIGADGTKASYSSYGLGIADLTAPGGDHRQKPQSSNQGCVLSTVPAGYGYYCGTSMATPHVVGVAALLASRFPSAGPTALTKMLSNQAETLPCPTDYDLNDDGAQDAACSGYADYNGFYGHGLVNALNAVR